VRFGLVDGLARAQRMVPVAKDHAAVHAVIPGMEAAAVAGSCVFAFVVADAKYGCNPIHLHKSLQRAKLNAAQLRWFFAHLAERRAAEGVRPIASSAPVPAAADGAKLLKLEHEISICAAGSRLMHRNWSLDGCRYRADLPAPLLRCSARSRPSGRSSVMVCYRRLFCVRPVPLFALCEGLPPRTGGIALRSSTSFTMPRLSFQISVDVGTLDLGLTVASAALAGGVDIVEMGTPLLKTQGVSNVVPAFRKRFPDALRLADMKTMDGGAGEARSVYAGGGNIFDLLALAGVDTAKSICAVRDEFRRADPELPRLVFSDIMVPQQGPAAQAGEVALRMVEAGVHAVGIHLQSDAGRANPKLIEDDYLSNVARAVFERIGKAVPVQVVGGLSIAQAKRLAKVGLRNQRQYGPAGRQCPLQPASGRHPAIGCRFHRRGLGRVGSARQFKLTHYRQRGSQPSIRRESRARDPGPGGMQFRAHRSKLQSGKSWAGAIHLLVIYGVGHLSRNERAARATALRISRPCSWVPVSNWLPSWSIAAARCPPGAAYV
jgi:3-hexulose-6-phosphate synthase